MTYDLIMMDGSAVQITMAGVGQQGDLWIHAVGLTFLECAAIFGNPEKTGRMSVEYSPWIWDEFIGYTELFSLTTADGFIKIGLAKGADEDDAGTED